MKIVINKCYGGYSLSPKAVLWLYEKGFNEEGFITPVEKYFGSTGCGKELSKWREYLAGKASNVFLITIFTPDEKAVLNERPELRTHPLLIECVERLGPDADGNCAELTVIEIPDDVDWEIHEYDGVESVHEKHRIWG